MPQRKKMSFPFFDETKELNENTRKASTGLFVALSDGVTHYELGGPKDGKPVVLVHGFSVPLFIFDSLFDFLTNAGFRVLRYDLFGRGYSDRPNIRYDINLFVRQLKELLDALGMSDITLLGLSMGGPVTTSFVNMHPRFVRKHVMIDPSGAKGVGLTWLLKITRLPILGEFLIALFGRNNMIKGIASDFFDPELVSIFQEKYKVQMEFKGFKRAILSTMRNGMLDSFLETYKKVGALKKPTLIFWGMNDETTPYADHPLILQALPHAEFHAIENCGHIPHYEKPEIFNPILLEFLSR